MSQRSFLSVGVFVATLLATPHPASAQGTWTPPIGIPAPSFGVTETIPTLPSPWSSAVSTFYFVCPSCAGATDTNNPQGYPANPRQTIPGTMTGPAVVVLDGQIDINESFVGNGTASAPIYVTSYRPATPAKLTAGLFPRGAYIIFDHLWLGPQNSNDTDFGFGLGEGAHHIAFRYSEIIGNAQRAGGVGLGTWSYTGSQSVSNVVIDHNTIHNIGDASSSADQDAHCVTLNGSNDHIWVTYNTLEYCSGDAMQVEAQQGRKASIHHVYYGKNVADHNRQTGGWVKNATDVIFSQNVGHDFRNNSGGPGACFGFQYDAEYVWFLFNEAYQCNIGIAISGTLVNPGLYAFVIGNLIHDTQSQAPTDVYNAGAMVIRGGTNIYVVNNTMVNVDAGVNMPPGSAAVHYYNNILFNRTNASTYDLYTEGSVSLDVKNNMFGTNARFGNASSGTAAILGDPAFVNTAGGDYHLQTTSRAIDAGLTSDVYTTFLNRYGLDIRKDADGKTRPAGAAWDLGRYESGATGAAPPAAPSAPVNLRILP